ncbi:hypothetical protein PV08_00420 [Exophiala spinifera]|uniref:Hsp70-like protein n=1 Tax=Exophiala spinifera TaxID=91928 RepID=A0A0D2BMP2_9EURO|nr:uncharacterized protein PV08_00420 [Exophiala spinifera]KIW19845.1 hypothetical protein PV08_00420 [Exophiala spinifera]
MSNAEDQQPEVQTIIVEWPNAEGEGGCTSDKVPTELAFSGDCPKWGFQIDEDEQRYQWFKLGIDPKQQQQQAVSHLSIAYPSAKALPPASDPHHSPVELATTYLICIRRHVEKLLTLKLGKGVIDTTPICYTITVPAIWDDAAKARTQQCAKNAGMGDEVRIISEPDAAIIYAIDTMDPHKFQVGDTFVVCDAGGGTVDLIAYKIIALHPKVEISEAVSGDGYACGSTFLNRIMAQFLEKHLKNVEGYDEDTLDEAMQDFETHSKRRFNGETAMTLRVRGLVDDQENGIRRQRLTIPAEKVKSMFEPVMSTILTLLMAQLRQVNQAKAILLVGGFGQSPYLRNCIKAVVPETVEILVPATGWTAVVRGALIKSLSDIQPDTSRITIASRVARKAYGVCSGLIFNSKVHQESSRYWDPFTGQYRARVMNWFIKQGDRLKDSEPVTASFYRTQAFREGAFGVVKLTIRAFASSEGLPAPMHQTSDVGDFVDLHADLSTISTSVIPIERGADNRRYYKLDYEIKATFFSAHTEWSLWYNNVEYGKVRAEYA